MDTKFVNAVKRKVKSLKKDDPFYSTEMLAEQLVCDSNVGQEIDTISDYQIAFHELYRYNDKLSDSLDKCLNSLSNQSHFRHDISNGYLSMIRQLRLPQDGTSVWQLLFETLVLPTEISGPILHLHFDGWELTDYNIYYWDERYLNDPEVA